jgi:predicted GNAT family acetyltransferase
MSTIVKDNVANNRYEIYLDDKLAGFEDYTLTSSVIAFNHTEVLPEFAGQGIAKRLTTEILEDARRRDLHVLPYCPYLAKFIAKHRDAYLDLVPIEKRKEFGLAQSLR